MSTLKIRGGKSLFGEVELPSNKNAVLPILCATILTQGEVLLKKIPKSPDVLKIIQALEKLGATCRWISEENILINTSKVNSFEVDECVSDIQAGILFAGPLLARFGQAIIPHGKGCKLGYRGPEKHIDFFNRVGVSCEDKDGKLFFEERVLKKELPLNKEGFLNDGIISKKIFFQKPVVTPTENVLMYLVARPEEVWSLHGLAQEPHVEDLVNFLNTCTTTQVIKGFGSSRKVQGSSEWKKQVSYEIQLDHIDAAGWISLAAITKGNIVLKGVNSAKHGNIFHVSEFFKTLGVCCEEYLSGLVISATDYEFSPDQTVDRYNEFSWKIVPGPWPQEPVDALPSFAALATTNRQIGTETHLVNYMFEDGLRYSKCFRDMGIPIVEQNMMITVKGYIPEVIHSQVTAPDVIEGVRAVIWVALGLPKGSEVLIRNWEPILRRNPKIIEILKNLGADIEIVD